MVVDNIRTRIETILYRYSIDSDFWQCFPLPQFGQIVDVCFVSSDKYFYAMGGCLKYPSHRNCADASRYNTITGTWEEIAHMREARLQHVVQQLMGTFSLQVVTVILCTTYIVKRTLYKQMVFNSQLYTPRLARQYYVPWNRLVFIRCK